MENQYAHPWYRILFNVRSIIKHGEHRVYNLAIAIKYLNEVILF